MKSVRIICYLPSVMLISVILMGCSSGIKKKSIPKTVKPNKIAKLSSSNPVMEAVIEGDHQLLVSLISEGHSIHSREWSGYSYLHMAAALGNQEVIEILINAGIPINLKLGRRQSTPVHSAVRWGQLPSVKTLVKRGAHYALVDSNGKTPKDLAVELDRKEILEYFDSLPSSFDLPEINHQKL